MHNFYNCRSKIESKACDYNGHTDTFGYTYKVALLHELSEIMLHNKFHNNQTIIFPKKSII